MRASRGHLLRRPAPGHSPGGKVAPHHCSLLPAPLYPYSRGHKVSTEPHDGLPEKVGHPEAYAPRARPLVSDGDVRRGV